MEKISQEKGKSADIEKNIGRLNQELSELKNQFDLSEEEIEKHRKLTSDIKTHKEIKENIVGDRDILSSFDKEGIFESIHLSSLLGSDYQNLSEAVRSKIEDRSKGLTAKYAEEMQGLIKNVLGEKQQELLEIESHINKKEVDHKPIGLKIQNSAPMNEKSKIIQTEIIKLDEAKKIEDRIRDLNRELDETAQRLKSYLDRKIEDTTVVKDKIREHPFTDKDDQLGIVIEHKCKSAHIQHILKDRVKYQSNSELRKFINDLEFDDDHVDAYVERLMILLIQARTSVLELKGENKISGVIQDILSNAIYLNYDLRLGEDSFSIMSPGKRALALLRVLVELDQSQHPIILDQPEDDLDNRSVYEGLVKYLKKKKNDRQIIVVTHNPNVVVGADSEYVIVANQSGQESNSDNRKFRFEYVYGGLENSFEECATTYVLERQGIREHVCEILDGGEAAFERRERLYSGFRKRSTVSENIDTSSIAAE